ncbi:quinate 5-dehydrogenase [Desulfolucanica intricata]|uniref:quinate 5-dehydrogenase n=1 Tax=Desulfolucanica intricata TaxID=1285191 RepID=UPI000830A7D2|nr:quinate 5-dehydrogenase [Desulfolucanica intricata]
MKKVVSVSLGSSKRDHSVEVELLGQQFQISRIGTDGDFNRAIETLRQLDGRVDAIGLGGIDVYLIIGQKCYTVRDGLKLMDAVRKSPVVDGSGLKNTLEREAVRTLAKKHGFLRPGTKVLMVSALDRFGMAEALAEVGCAVTFGDMIFTAGIPYPVTTITELEELAGKLLPELVKLPFHMLYPTGKKQEISDRDKARKFLSFYEEAEVIAGDFHLIKRFLPETLNGQVILTNTTTKDDVEHLEKIGAGCLITTTPELQGRSFGANVMEAVLVALLEKPTEMIQARDYLDILKQLNFAPRIKHFNEEKCLKAT